MRFMKMLNLSILLCRVLIILTTCCFISGTAAAKNPKYEACRQASPCGEWSIKYPFWTKNEFCGQRDFQIECNRNQPLFDLVFGHYQVGRVKHSDDEPESYSLDLQAKVDFNATCLRDFQYCTSRPHNQSTCPITYPDPGLAPPGRDISNVTIKVFFFYHCNSSFSLNHSLPLTCSPNKTGMSYVALRLPQHEDGQLWSVMKKRACKSHVSSVINLTSSDFDNGTIKYKRFFEGNFTLKLQRLADNNCEECRSSGGECGSEGDQFQCLCSDGNESRTCIKGKNDKPLKIGLGTAIGTLSIIVILMAIFMMRYRRMHPSSKVLSKNNSAENSLMSEMAGSHVYFEVPIFQNKELEEATNNFNSSQELGDGGFGTVYYGKLRDGREVAVKRLYENNCRRVKQFMTEVQILTRLHHKNLVSLYGCTSRQSRELLLVYEYVPNGTVADHLHGDRTKEGPLPWHIRMSIAVETATALAYLHASDIIHRDVKTNNILLDNNFCVKVGDFGLSRLFPTDVTHVSTAPQGTPGYVDPEYHQCYQLTEKSDVYSFGVVLVELLSSLPAVDISRDRHEINLASLAINRIQRRAFHQLIDPQLGFDSDVGIREMITGVTELAFMCLQQEKEMRPSMVTVLEQLNVIAGGRKAADESKRFLPSPEYDEALLLKKKNFPSSPISVTQKWVSSGSSCTPSTSA